MRRFGARSRYIEPRRLLRVCGWAACADDSAFRHQRRNFRGEEGRWGRVTPHHHPELWDWAPEDDRKANRRTHIQTRLQISIFYRRRHSG